MSMKIQQKILLVFSVIILGGIIVWYLFTRQRTYIAEDKGMFITEESGKYGIRDKSGEVLPNEYVRIEKLDENSDYIAVIEPQTEYTRYGDRYTTEVIQIFDLKSRQFVFQSWHHFGIDSIARINENEYKLFDNYGRYFAELRLPGKHGERFESTPTVIPHFSDYNTSLSEFIHLGETLMSTPNDGYWKEMFNVNPIAYKYLHRMSAMSDVELSPENDLQFSRALYHFAKLEPRYDGNMDKAFDEVDDILKILDGGNTNDMTIVSSFERLMANARLSFKYDTMIHDFPLYAEEYIAWHNMMEAIICYSDFVIDNDRDNYCQCRDMDNEYSKKEIFEQRSATLEIEQRILSGVVTHIENAADLKSKEDVNKIFERYHHWKTPYYWHPMWNEIRFSFNKWCNVREKIAQTLSNRFADSYREVTKHIINQLFDIISASDTILFVPALPWDEDELSAP